MISEILFLKYAYPCSFVLLSRDEMTKKEHNLIYKSAKEEKIYLPIKKIEKIFWRALNFIGSISDLKSVQNYWWFDHNKNLKLKNFKEVDDNLIKDCMVIPCEVLSVAGSEAEVKSPFFDKVMRLKTDFIDIKPGDRVTKHYDYISEKITENLYLKIEESLKKLGF